jgi:hypothetical protein
MSDEGIRYTAGTPVAGNIMFYWGVSRGIIDPANQWRCRSGSRPNVGRKIAETDPASVNPDNTISRFTMPDPGRYDRCVPGEGKSLLKEIKIYAAE